MKAKALLAFIPNRQKYLFIVFLLLWDTAKVSFTLHLSDLSYYHEDMSFDYDPGEFELYIGPDSDVREFILFTVR